MSVKVFQRLLEGHLCTFLRESHPPPKTTRITAQLTTRASTIERFTLTPLTNLLGRYLPRIIEVEDLYLPLDSLGCMCTALLTFYFIA